MPIKLEKELKASAEKKGLKGKRKNAYIYGTLRSTGWKPKREKTASEVAFLEGYMSK